MRDFTFTSESVTAGHPDKICDQISDAVLDAVLAADPKGRVACETLATTGLVVVAGEITTNAAIDYRKIARETIKRIGYDDPKDRFEAESCGVMLSLGQQSLDISVGVTEGEGLHKEQGAGDQGLMFGFACDQTEELMPMPITLAHKLTRRLEHLLRSGEAPWLRPDGKSQVSVRYADGKPVAVDAVVVSTMHRAEINYADLVAEVRRLVVEPVIPAHLLHDKTHYHINPTGIFIIGGPHGDCGLTGRKIIVDTYGGWGRHGGGAFSGKDPSKVDRSAAYFARYVAKNIVAAGLASECEVQVSYAIGVAKPTSVKVDCYGSENIDPHKIEKAALEVFDFRPQAIIAHLDLLRPIYSATASGGHFGRDQAEFTWERTDATAALRSACGI
ncbi:MAG: methionine adenosyltransferase [Deltaproteobacteria bacterium]|nr:methionine adenosyltransferase [Deltaproteobacteria bacterium]